MRRREAAMVNDKIIPPQVNVIGERPRIGVFVCNCGINIAGVVDVKAVRDYAKSLPYVEYVHGQSLHVLSGYPDRNARPDRGA